MNDFEYLERLLDLLNRSNAETIEIRKWTTTYRVSKSGGNHGPVVYQAGPAPSASAAPSAARPGRSAAGEAAEPVAATPLLEIKSPMVGTFYARPEPGAEAYVRVGTRIAPGGTLCIIEAMKIMNPLDAEIAGVIREVCVEDAEPVEFGHVLFRVDPNG
ncbi:MAG: acetyl-CoA carboxylase biotin carboxyl carrier protein [Gemmatimonadetes bacterium]|nr:acetyl-CoA carboxylase biotin carboxyl carrier protein [Gemmatimonadota bacterium]